MDWEVGESPPVSSTPGQEGFKGAEGSGALHTGTTCEKSSPVFGHFSKDDNDAKHMLFSTTKKWTQVCCKADVS